MKAKIFVMALSACLLAGAAPAGAVTVNWDDLTDAQQEAAYSSLESENESLRQQLDALRAGSGDTAAASGGSDASAGDAADAGENDASAAAGPGESVSSGDAAVSQLKDTGTFLKDLGDSFAKRQQAAAAYSQGQLAQMSAEEVWDYRFRCAEAERDFYDTYSGAQFDSLNILYLCEEYCGGLGKQYRAEEVFSSSQDAEKTSELYTAGYYNRAYALVEFHDYYGLDLADGYQNLKDAVTKMDAASGEETRNAGVDAATVKNVQEMLNRLGFLCGQADGICGRQTVSCVERFQVMYGFKPADGLIDDELIAQMQEIIAKQGG